MKLACGLYLSQRARFLVEVVLITVGFGYIHSHALGVGQGPERVSSQRNGSSPRASGGHISVPPWLFLPTCPTFQDVHLSCFPHWWQLWWQPVELQ